MLSYFTLTQLLELLFTFSGSFVVEHKEYVLLLFITFFLLLLLVLYSWEV